MYLCLNQLTILILENLIGMENDIKIQFAIGILTLIISSNASANKNKS